MTHLVPLNRPSRSDAPRIVLVAGALGNVLNLWPLAQALAADCAVFGLELRGLKDGEEPFDSIDAAAAAFVPEVRAELGTGQLLLGGFCSGGLIGLEMARLLEAETGALVPVLLLDSSVPGPRRDFGFGERIAWHVWQARREGPLYPLRWTWRRAAWELRKLFARSTSAGPQEQHDPRSGAVFAAMIRAVAEWQPKRYSGPVHLYRPPLDRAYTTRDGIVLDRNRSPLDADNYLRRFLPHLRTHEVACEPGDHDHFVAMPHAEAIAVGVRGLLTQVEAVQTAARPSDRT